MLSGVAAPLILLVVGGDPSAGIRLPSARALAVDTIVVAADSGIDRALAGGLAIHHAVGDFDSVSAEGLAAAEAAGTTVHRHPADKDATDLELALDLVAELDPTAELLVVGAGGGRLDHQLADLLALAAPALAGRSVRARFGTAEVAVARPGPPVELTGTPGEQVSLLPVHGLARGVTTTGLRWPLLDADLVPGTTRALSNELVDGTATASIADGVLLVVQPGTASGPISARATPYDPTPTAP